MAHVTDSTESLVARTKKLLADRGDTSLQAIAIGAEVSPHWLRSFSCGRATNPSVLNVEKLYAYLIELHAARRFERRSEARAS
jgi:hypothetical protein